MTYRTFDTLRHFYQVPSIAVTADFASHLCRFCDCVFQLDVESKRDHFCEPVAELEWQRHCAGCVANCGLGPECSERDYLSHVIATVVIDAVFDHFFTAVVGKVHIDVGHFAPFDVQEPFKEEIGFDRVDLRDFEAVKHKAGCGRAPYSRENSTFVDEVEDVPANKEIVRELGLFDDPEFVLQALGHLLAGRFEPLLEARIAELSEVFHGRLVFWSREPHYQVAAELKV